MKTQYKIRLMTGAWQVWDIARNQWVWTSYGQVKVWMADGTAILVSESPNKTPVRC